jgi:hypothetical protein
MEQTLAPQTHVVDQQQRPGRRRRSFVIARGRAFVADSASRRRQRSQPVTTKPNRRFNRR